MTPQERPSAQGPAPAAPSWAAVPPSSGWDALHGVPEGDDVWRTLADRHRGPLRRYFRAHPRVMDGIVCAVYALLCILPMALVAGDVDWWNFLPLLVVLVALFFRRRVPLVVLAVVAVAEVAALFLGIRLSSSGVGIWFALYAVARQYSTSRTYAIGLLVSAVESAGIVYWVTRLNPEVYESPGMIFVVLGVFLCFCLVGNLLVIVLGSSMRNAQLHEAELQSWARRAQDLARGRERNRIAGEMHDIVAHSLSVMIALSDGARRVSPKNPERAAEVMGDVSKTGRRALNDLRRSLGVLRADEDAPLAPAGDAAHLDEMLDGFRATGLPLRIDSAGELPEDPALRLTVVRIIQESLTNALRYAKRPTLVLVRIRADFGGVHVRVRDDGRQAGRRPQSQGSGIGLSGMVERATLFGGTVTAGPLEDGGWGVEAWLPAPKTEGREEERA